mmetsp:Transcript_27504/g.36782  ORF Transcript_27504/g.36782 Transcript_27504/m.36782 type:complete len:104 (-) Transcript_27504:602-913(-)
MFDDNIGVEYSNPDTGLSYTEQLYTARGSQGIGTFKKVTSFGVEPENYKDVLAYLQSQNEVDPIEYQLRPLWTTKIMPNFLPHKYYGMFSLPHWCQIANSTVD